MIIRPQVVFEIKDDGLRRNDKRPRGKSSLEAVSAGLSLL